MIRARLEDGVQINRIHAQALQVVQLILNALEVAAEKLRAIFIEVGAGLAWIKDRFVPGGVRNGRLAAIESRTARRISSATGIVGYVAIAEAVREYLIDVGIVQPRRRL